MDLHTIKNTISEYFEPVKSLSFWLIVLGLALLVDLFDRIL